MFPVLWDFDLGRFGHFTLGTYGLFYALAFLLAVKVAMVYARREGIEPSRMIDLGIWTLLSGIIGAKLLLVLIDFRYYWNHKMEVLYNWRSAGVFYGGFILAVTVGMIYVRRQGLPLAKVADAAIPGLALSQALGRGGCLSAGCCYGKPTESILALTFTNPRAQELTGVPLGVALHPTQIYHAVAALAIFGLLVFLYPKKKSDGTIFWTYIICYAVLRFLIEFVRGDYRGQILGGWFSTSQVVAILAAAVGTLVLFRIRSRRQAQ